MASKNQNSTISVKKNGTFAMCINGIMRHFIVEVSAEVDADVTQASFRGNRYEPADPPGVSVTGAEVENAGSICFTISGMTPMYTMRLLIRLKTMMMPIINMKPSASCAMTMDPMEATNNVD